jgi:hypothetical protein
MNRKIVDKLDRKIEDPAFKAAVVATTGRAVWAVSGGIPDAKNVVSIRQKSFS